MLIVTVFVILKILKLDILYLVEMDKKKLWYIFTSYNIKKQITNKDLLYSKGKYTQYFVIIYNGNEAKEKKIYMYV